MGTTTVTATWVGPDLEYECTDPKGNIIKLGKDDFSPSHLVLLGLAGCMGMDIKAVLGKKRIEVDSIEISVTGHQQESYPKPYHTVDVHFTVKGEQVSDSAVERAIALSHDKYCIVGQSLQNVSTINTSFEVV
jgi:putative redox protein